MESSDHLTSSHLHNENDVYIIAVSTAVPECILMANLGLSEHQLILDKTCESCGERFRNAKDEYESENSFI